MADHLSGPPGARRALPPRPSLLVGDLDACAAELDKLQAAAAALRREGGPSSQRAWAQISHRYRWLRESLVSQRAGDSALAVAVYGAAADAALRAQDWGEFLKSASHLVDVDEAAGQDGGARRPPPPPPPPPRPSAWGSDEEGGAGPTTSPDHGGDDPWRRGEALASLILYFAAASPSPACLDAARLLRKATAGKESSLPPDLAFALAVHAAVRSGDGLRVCALLAGPPPPSSKIRWREAALCAPALARARRAGLAALSASYRTLPAAAAVARLGLGDGDSAYAALAALVRAEAGGGDGEGEGAAAAPPGQAWAVRALPGAVRGGELVFKG